MSRFFQSLLFGKSQRIVWIRLTVMVVLAMLGRFAWLFYESEILARPDYILNEHKVEVLSVPKWIPNDFKKYVFYFSNQINNDSFNILDDGIANQVARAFECHPWVKQVESVKIRYPAHARLQIRFRDPVAFIETPGSEEKAGFLVDSEGIVLPSEYFNEHQELLEKFFYVEGINTKPFSNNYGDTWGDHNVAEVSLLASFLAQDKEFLGLDRIEVKISEDGRELNQYKIYTKKGLEIIWGTFPNPGNLKGEDDINNRERKEKLKRNLFEKQLFKLDRLRSLRGIHDKSLDNIPAKDRPVDLSKKI